MKRQENKAFISFPNDVAGLIFDDSKNEKYPLKYYNVIEGRGLSPDPELSYFIYVYDGNLKLVDQDNPVQILTNGMFMSVKGDIIFSTLVKCKAIVIEVLNGGYYKETNYSAYRMIGGPIENVGRLKYIDGCTDSLLLSPIKKGDPCLNHLHFPTNINQTQHTHPSHRIGIVASGYGKCITPFGELDLVEGNIFVIKAWDGQSYSSGVDGMTYPEGQHAFQTFGENMNVIAFHPDSDFGPTDEKHPMINRTMVDGRSASELDDIRTQ